MKMKTIFEINDRANVLIENAQFYWTETELASAFEYAKVIRPILLTHLVNDVYAARAVGISPHISAQRNSGFGNYEATLVHIVGENYVAAMGWTTDGPDANWLAGGIGDLEAFHSDLVNLNGAPSNYVPVDNHLHVQLAFMNRPASEFSHPNFGGAAFEEAMRNHAELYPDIVTKCDQAK